MDMSLCHLMRARILIQKQIFLLNVILCLKCPAREIGKNRRLYVIQMVCIIIKFVSMAVTGGVFSLLQFLELYFLNCTRHLRVGMLMNYRIKA